MASAKLPFQRYPLAWVTDYSKCKCTFQSTGKQTIWQLWAPCYDCFEKDNEGACECCLATCHAGHKIGVPRMSPFFCDCGAVYQCDKGKLAQKAEPIFADFHSFKTFYESNNYVGCRLMSILELGTVFSPLSIRYAMSMIQRGTTGNTCKQIFELFAYMDQLPDIKAVNKLFNTDIIHLATAIIIRNDVHLKQNFTQAIGSFALVTKEDFSNKAVVIGKANEYIASSTNNMITDPLKEEMITDDTIIIMLNTLYFKAAWLHKFPSTFTQRENFNNGAVQVDMMKHSEYFPYYEDDRVQLVELPYNNCDLCMGVILPKEPNNDFTSYLRKNAKYNADYVEVHLPKFTKRKNIDLIPIMKKLGVTDLFDSNCRMDEMIDGKAHVSTMVHDAMVVVNEHGTEASAATVLFYVKESCCDDQPPAKIFYANRTFVYYIKHMPTGMLLFVGSYDGK